ncbi:MAG TPA: GNAT family N-acetyltransferase [Thermoanaerobaculaceae bacterium]|nr:GNAT family N-acetyltransferase [Thermoanaerobaculaceae bacterium]
MAGKVKVQPVSRVGIEPLVAMAEQLRASLPGWDDTAREPMRGQAPSDLALDLAHLAHHDGDGFLVASVGDEVVGFAASFVRSRQLTVTQPWLLPEFEDHEVAEMLLRRAIAYGDRSGATEWTSHLLCEAHWQAAFFRFGLRPRFPVYRLSMTPEAARIAGRELAKLLPGSELTRDALTRRAGAADLERLDRLARGVARPMDHEYWLGERRLRLAKVRDGERISAYAYGGPGQCGPVAGATTEATLAGIGWALQLAADSEAESVQILVPAVFESALDHLFDAGARCLAASTWMTRNPGGSLERYVLPSVTLA